MAILPLIILFSIFISNIFTLPVIATNYIEEAENRKFLEVQSNNYDNWPLGPSIGAQAAILMDANTGAILYSKNIHEKLYPASITKLLTSYIAVKECDLNDEITFSQEAVSSIDWKQDANMAVNPGAVLSLEDVLSGILIGSANEAAYTLAQHISGDMTSFSSLMNKTAKELGCLHSNFITPNGIHDENHYTTAYDMALIAKAFFSVPILSQLSGTLSFEVPVNNTQTKEGIILTAKSQLLPGKPYAYDSLIGTKTGYTSVARQTLVSCAERNGVKLICVILKEEAPFQFSDTVDLFNYGFNNFNPVYLQDVDNPYSIDNHFFSTSVDIFGNSNQILLPDREDYILLPSTLTFEQLSSKVSYKNTGSDTFCTIEYYYKDLPVGNVDVKLAIEKENIFDFSNGIIDVSQKASTGNEKIIFINVFYILFLLIALIGLIIIIIISRFLYLRFLKSEKRKRSSYRRGFRKRRRW